MLRSLNPDWDETDPILAIWPVIANCGKWTCRIAGADSSTLACSTRSGFDLLVSLGSERGTWDGSRLDRLIGCPSQGTSAGPGRSCREAWIVCRGRLQVASSSA